MISDAESLRTILDMHFRYEDLKERELKLEKENKTVKLPERYIINKDATILFWKDGEKTIVRRCEDDTFNPRLAFLTAFFQHYCGMSKNKANKYLANLEVEQPMEIKKFRVGDTVTIREDLKNFETYGGDVFIEEGMGQFKGKQVTISKIIGNGKYSLKEDDEWNWTDKMFKENKKPKHMKEDQ